MKTIISGSLLNDYNTIHDLSQKDITTLHCFLCGVCCTKYHVRITLSDAKTIAAKLDMELDDFLLKYTDARWPGQESFILKRSDEGCIFLKRKERQVALCSIHDFKPQTCVEWSPSHFRKECQEGLKNCWNLEFDVHGQVRGQEQDVERFMRFIDSLA